MIVYNTINIPNIFWVFQFSEFDCKFYYQVECSFLFNFSMLGILDWQFFYALINLNQSFFVCQPLFQEEILSLLKELCNLLPTELSSQVS